MSQRRHEKMVRREWWAMLTLALGLFSLVFSLVKAPHARASDEVVTLAYWHFYGNEMRSLHEQVIAEFNRTHPGIQVKSSYGGTPWTMRDRLLVSLAGGGGPDVASVDQFWISQLAAGGYAVKLQERIQASDVVQADDVMPVYWETARHDGEIWSMPFAASSILLYYNVDLLHELGLSTQDVPRTWDDLRTLSSKALRGSQDDGRRDFWMFDMPTLARFGNMYYWIAFLWQHGGELFSSDLESVAFQGVEGVETLAFWQELLEAGVIATDPPANVWESGKALFQAASSARIQAGYGDLDFSYDVAPLPMDRYRVTGLGGKNLALFTRDPRKQDAAWRFIEWMTRRDVNVAWSIGTGYAPLRQSAYASSAYQQALMDEPRLQVALTEMLYARPRPNIPAYGDVSRELGLAIEEVLLNGRDPERALLDAAERSQEIMDRVKDR